MDAANKATGRNTEVDLLRVVFATVVLIHHSHGLNPPDIANYPFVGGYIAVEFFFLLTGFFAAREVSEADIPAPLMGAQAIKWTFSKFSRIFPFVVPAVFIHYIMVSLLNNSSGFETIKSLVYGIFEAALLPASGIYESFMILPLWYLSALLVLLPLFYYLLMKAPAFFPYVAAPLSALMIYGYFSVSVGHIDVWYAWHGIYDSLPRCWAGLCMGTAAFTLVRKVKSYYPCHRITFAWYMLELFCFGSVLFYAWGRTHRRLDFLCIVLLFGGVCALLTHDTVLPVSAPVGRILADFSLALYVTHWTVRMVVQCTMNDSSYLQKLPTYLIASFLYALVLMLLVHSVRKIIRINRPRLNKRQA